MFLGFFGVLMHNKKLTLIMVFLFGLAGIGICEPLGKVSVALNSVTSMVGDAITASNCTISTKIIGEKGYANYASPAQSFGAVDDTFYRYETKLLLNPSPKISIDVSQSGKPFSTNRTGGVSTENKSLSIDTYYKATSELTVKMGVSRLNDKYNYEDSEITDPSLLSLQTETSSSRYYGSAGNYKINTEEMCLGLNYNKTDSLTISGLLTFFRTTQVYPNLGDTPDRTTPTEENSVWKPGMRGESKASFFLSPKFRTELAGSIDPPRLVSFYSFGGTYYRIFEEQTTVSFGNYYQMTPGLTLNAGFSQTQSKSSYTNPFETTSVGTELESSRSLTNNQFWTGFEFKP